jgi:flagellar P-ring protein FlgI
MRNVQVFVVALVVLVCAAGARASTVGQIARIQGQGESVLRGVGLVVGLNGTGDNGKDLVLARPLAAVYANNGNPVLLDELKNARTVALVTVTVTVPEAGARTDDRFDIAVAAMHSATSLAGGRLYLVPLQGPFPGQPVYAVGEGEVMIESAASPRTGRVRGGARMIRDIRTGEVSDSFTLILRPPFAGWAAASEVASTITQNIYGSAALAMGGLPAVATVIDDRTIRIDIPVQERASAAAFVGDVLSTPINMNLLRLPAQVIYNKESGMIVVTGDVEISPVAITHKDLTITTVVPPPVPTLLDPLVETRRWTGVATTGRPTERARLQDLLDAFNQLRVPVTEQIAILSMLEKTGKLHARLVVD